MIMEMPPESDSASWSGGTGWSLRCFCITSFGVVPSKGTRPVTMW